MQREMACGVFTMTQFKLCGRQESSSRLHFFLNTVEMMEYINANGGLWPDTYISGNEYVPEISKRDGESILLGPQWQ